MRKELKSGDVEALFGRVAGHLGKDCRIEWFMTRWASRAVHFRGNFAVVEYPYPKSGFCLCAYVSKCVFIASAGSRTGKILFPDGYSTRHPQGPASRFEYLAKDDSELARAYGMYIRDMTKDAVLAEGAAAFVDAAMSVRGLSGPAAEAPDLIGYETWRLASAANSRIRP